MRLAVILVSIAVAYCTAAGDGFETGVRIASEVMIASPSGPRPAEVSLREITVKVSDKTSHGVQIIVRDPVSNRFWSDLIRSRKPLQAQTMWNEWFAKFRFASNDKQIAVFHLHVPFIDATVSSSEAGSLLAAEQATLKEVRRELENTWPITRKSPPVTSGSAPSQPGGSLRPPLRLRQRHPPGADRPGDPRDRVRG